MLIEKLKLCKNTGLCCVAGIDIYDVEFIHVHECSTDKFIYSCGNKFDMDLLYSFFPRITNNGNIIMVSGDFTWIYDVKFSSADMNINKDSDITNKDDKDNKHSYTTNKVCGNIKFSLQTKITGLLNKRQSRGGMSQNRIARLAEDSRLHYCTRIIDSISKCCKENKECIYMFGSAELCKKIKTLCKTVSVIDKWHSWEDPYNFLINNKNELLDIFLKPSDKDEEKVKNVLELVKKDPDWLLFGKDIKDCEYVVAIDSSVSESTDILVKKNSSMYAELSLYKRIGKKYFKDAFTA